MMQTEIPLAPAPVTPETIASKQTLTAALRLSIEVSQREEKSIRMDLEIDAGQWSRIMNGSGAHFPHDKLDKFMELTGNDIPLDWLALRRGKGTHLLETEKDRQLRAELEKERGEKKAIAKFLKESRVI